MPRLGRPRLGRCWLEGDPMLGRCKGAPLLAETGHSGFQSRPVIYEGFGSDAGARASRASFTNEGGSAPCLALLERYAGILSCK